jgi:hypothetical protein
MNKQIYSPPIVDSGLATLALGHGRLFCRRLGFGRCRRLLSRRRHRDRGRRPRMGPICGCCRNNGGVGCVDLSPCCRLFSEMAFDDLGLGTSAGTANLEHSLVRTESRAGLSETRHGAFHQALAELLPRIEVRVNVSRQYDVK